ncbi:MAG: PaaI family thioesterase [Oryzomonas sp.]|uniref:PaaI family thioesterase n=1 Tax=Oryzomonas sp. TaxID=2855186 RepID=UPI002849EC8E|nr:PaaI family thioesterase [Oryzomonas sp.]MDR3579835.1 PaaI family thioesterase [Oryzomonas sp.]
MPVVKDAPLPFRMPDWIALAPFETYLGMSIDEAADGRAVLSMPFSVAHCQGAGLMHGGAMTSLADTALAIAIKTLLPEGTHFATIELSMQFKSPVRWGTIRGIAEVTDRTERDITGTVAIVDEDGITAATFQARFRVKRLHN